MMAFVLFFLAIIAQATVFQFIKMYGVSFDAVLAVAIVLGFLRGDYQRLLIPVFIAGIILDGMSGAPFGAVTIALVAAVTVLSALSAVLAREHVVHFLVFALVGSICFSVTVFFITMIMDPRTGMSATGVLPVIGYNGAGALILYLFSRWIILLKNRTSGR